MLPNVMLDQLPSSKHKDTADVHKYPTLDIHTLEAPLSAKPTESMSRSTDLGPQQRRHEWTGLGLDLPSFPSLHVNHRPLTPTQRSAEERNDPMRMEKPEALDEIQFHHGMPTPTMAATVTTGRPTESAQATPPSNKALLSSSGVSPPTKSQRARFPFRPIDTKVIMTHDQLISAVQALMHQEKHKTNIEEEFNSLLE